MGGKTAQSTAQVQIPPEVMAQYNAVNAKAEQAGATPFQPYSNNPDAFVAPLTGTQQSAIMNTNAAQGTYQPFFNAATQSLAGGQNAADPLQAAAAGNIQGGLNSGSAYNSAATNLSASALGAAQPFNSSAAQYASASGQAVNPTALGAAQINQFMSPYLDTQAQGVLANLRQDQQTQQSAMQGDQIKAGAFGGDRGRIGQANLARQQNLATGQVLGDIYQGGYASALGAAQQQQGVNLGAGQANRQALGAAGQQMQNIGQQVYGQQSGTAGQLANIGQQSYGQALGAAGAQQGLGQQVYGQGAATSQQLQNLGTGAQANALSGAQAQMGAGQIEQQTQQAGLQSQYNQFLQQQGYPFQVAQFLAGIAMGTGSLSGSTTTNTQPTSFFGGLSDARMKENMETVGKTFDGQNIIKFNYKGQKRKQIGLVAQEVEKKYPDAVRMKNGLKYVDYDRATKAAVDSARKQYAEGGAVAGSSLEDILAMQRAMYPWLSENQSRTGGGTGPHGVGLMQLPTTKLQTAEAPKIKDEGLGAAVNTLESGEKLYDMGKDAVDWIDKKTSTEGEYDPNKDEFENASEGRFFYRGGLVRKQYAGGGAPGPYQEGDGYVPDGDFEGDSPKLKTADAPDPSKARSTMDDVKDIAKIAAMFMNRGGRAGYADGGSPFLRDVDNLSEITREYDPLKLMYRGAKAVTDYTVPKVKDYFLGSDEPRGLNIPVSSVERDPSMDDVSTPTAAPALGGARNLPALPETEVPPARSTPPMVMEEHDAPEPGLGAAAVSDNAQPPRTDTPPPEGPPSPSKGRGSFMSRNEDWLVPLLKGVGTMASSPSRYLGTALLQGAGAAAGSWQDTQKQQLSRESKDTSIEQQRATIASTAYDPKTMSVRVFDDKGRMTWMPWSDYLTAWRKGKRFQLAPMRKGEEPPEQGTPPAAIPGAPGVPTEAPKSNTLFTPEDGAYVDKTVDNMLASSPGFDVSQFTNQPQMSPFAHIAQNARVSYDTDPQTKELGVALSKMAAANDTGPVSQRLMPMQQWVNDMLRQTGINYQVADPSQLATQEEIQKISTMLSQQAAQSGNQESYAALEHALHAIPNLVSSPQGAGKLMADVLIQRQRAKDLNGFATEWRNRATEKTGNQNLANYSGAELEKRFDERFSSQYGRDKQALESIFHDSVTNPSTGKEETMFQFLYEHGGQLSPAHRAQLEQLYPGAMRYFNLSK